MRLRLFRWLALTGVLAIAAAGTASARGTGRVFYLTVHPRQCLIKANVFGPKMVQVVPCSNAAHNLEIFATGHGRWGTRPPSNTGGLAVARGVCLSAYQRITGHVLGRGWGWEAFWPDAGAETAKYGDRIICGLRTWPALHALGAGWHVR